MNTRGGGEYKHSYSIGGIRLPVHTVKTIILQSRGAYIKKRKRKKRGENERRGREQEKDGRAREGGE